MLLITGVLIVATAALSVLRMRTLAVLHPAPLGWMSEQWLDEHRTAHPS